MDPNLLQNLDYFGLPNTSTTSAADAVPAIQSPRRDAAGQSIQELWNTALGLDTATPSASSAPVLPSFTQPSVQTAASPYDSIATSSVQGQSKPSLPQRTAQSATAQRRRDGHERKRAKVNSDAAALDSVDYWLQFDDDDADRGMQSFEIDFSKRQNNSNRQRQQQRPFNALNPLSSTPGLGSGLYTQSSLQSAFKEEDFLDDSALDNALSDDDDVLESLNLSDQLSKIDSQPPTDVPPREGLYSTPLSWEKPQPGLRMDPLLGMGDIGGSMGLGGVGSLGLMNIGTPMLTEAEQRRLLAIAMNSSRTPSGFSLGYGVPLSTGFGAGFDPGLDPAFDFGFGTTSLSQVSKTTDSAATANGQADVKTASEREASQKMPPPKRTNTMNTDKGKEKERPRDAADKDKDKDKGKLGDRGDRTAHNDIERKYRTNLKDRISELRDAIPALRGLPDEGADEGEGGSSSRAPKVSKGTVLTKATEYIQQLERTNKSVLREHQELARRLQAFEQLLNATARQPFLMPNYSRTLFDPRGFC